MALRLKLLLVSLSALSLLSPIPVQAWQMVDGRWAVVNPGDSLVGAYSSPQTRVADLNGDGQPEEIRLQDHRASIWRGDAPLWESPPDWQVEQAIVGDLTRDNTVEVVLLVWRPFFPWPIDRYIPNPGRIQDFQNAAGFSCHVILIGWEQGRFRERWAGSALARPLLDMAEADLNADGWPDLAAVETSYQSAVLPAARSISAWQWNGFGFSLIDRHPIDFSHHTFVYTNSGSLLILGSPQASAPEFPASLDPF
jgi:hypothetical protein